MEIDNEDRILKVRIRASENTAHWYHDRLGEEIEVIDHFHDGNYKCYHPHNGYIKKDLCDVTKVLQDRTRPDFPFLIRINQCSGFPQCWYKEKLGEIFEITSSNSSDWITENKCIKKHDSKIIGKSLVWFIEYDGGEWLSSDKKNKTIDANEAFILSTEKEAKLFLAYYGRSLPKAEVTYNFPIITEHEFVTP